MMQLICETEEVSIVLCVELCDLCGERAPVGFDNVVWRPIWQV